MRISKLLSVFEIEDGLKAVCDVPVFHDDQHGSAIVIAAGLLNALEVVDVFIGLAGANLLSTNDLAKMAKDPIVFACSNPDQEIDPMVVREVRADAIMATGRSDYPNQVNNVLAFPFVIRGALDARASEINDEMKIATVYAIKDLAKEPPCEKTKAIYASESLDFGKEYILPKPFDSRLK